MNDRNVQLLPLTATFERAWFALYRASFPSVERTDPRRLTEMYAAGANRLLVLADNDAFVGLAVTAAENDLTFVDYLATEPRLRGNGYGSLALDAIKRQTARIVLEIESPQVECDNVQERVRRKAFYARNGFTDSGMRLRVYGTVMELLTVGEAGFDEYLRLFDRTHPDVPPQARPVLIGRGDER